MTKKRNKALLFFNTTKGERILACTLGNQLEHQGYNPGKISSSIITHVFVSQFLGTDDR